MAQFRVGQRVRVIRSIWGYEGKEATVIGDGRYFIHNHWGTREYGWPVDVDGVGRYAPDGSRINGLVGWIAPLLPPDEAADAFMARLKKLGSEPVNDAPKVTERVAK